MALDVGVHDGFEVLELAVLKEVYNVDLGEGRGTVSSNYSIEWLLECASIHLFAKVMPLHMKTINNGNQQRTQLVCWKSGSIHCSTPVWCMV